MLLVYPLRKAAVGLDLMDAGYALANYRFFETMHDDWRIATFLANVTGVILSKLPYGNTWVGMNVYTGLLIGITAAAAYCFLNTQKIGNKYLLFLGELIALSLCWSPNVILYHYLGYILMTAATILLYSALTKERNAYFIIAGVILGCAVAVRMPNITYMALIVPVWFYTWLNRKEHPEQNWFSKLLGQTGYCVGGYAIGLGVPLAYICVRYGVEAYPKMITWLFGMTETATDYKPTSMVSAMFEDYIRYSLWLLLFVAYLVAGLVFVRIAKGRFEKTKKIIYVLGMFVLLRLCYGRGMFNFDYSAYFSFYKWITVFLLISILLCVWLLLCKKAEKEHKLWAVFLLVIIFVTPLGSNNGLYPIINNLFLVCPLTLAFLWSTVKGTTMNAFVCKSMTIFFCACVAVQSILFGLLFIFHDAAKEYTCAPIRGSASTAGLIASVDKSKDLDLLGGYLTENDLLEKEVILYGNIPALAYIFDLQPAIFSTWADLDSNPVARLEEELTDEVLRAKEPLVILHTKEVQVLQSGQEDRKLAAIMDFVEQNGYICAYTSDSYQVYCK